MGKAVIISYNPLQNRVQAARELFIKQGCECFVVTSDFLHGKGYIQQQNMVKDFIYVHSKPYKKNISLARIRAYKGWAKDAFCRIKQIKPDIIYLNVPLNSLLPLAARYKKHNKNVKLVVDIIDLWPESLPIGGKKKLLFSPLLNIWKNYRNKNLRHCDKVLTECNLYCEVLGRQGIDVSNFSTLHLFGGEPYSIAEGEQAEREQAAEGKGKELNFLYLGSINNIIDIDRTVEFLASLTQHGHICLHIIGEGEQRERFVALAQAAGIDVVYHGTIYDEDKKHEIMRKCDFGLNVYKSNIEVGLTIKSIDYFRESLPIINTIKGDTHSLVQTHRIGFNLCAKTAQQVAVMSESELWQMKLDTLQVYNNYFTKQVFFGKLQEALKNI